MKDEIIFLKYIRPKNVSNKRDRTHLYLQFFVQGGEIFNCQGALDANMDRCQMISRSVPD
jgi:hypothetical protein